MSDELLAASLSSVTRVREKQARVSRPDYSSIREGSGPRWILSPVVEWDR